MQNKIDNSIVAQGGSSISNAQNINQKHINRIKRESILIGFIVGVFSSVIANYIYEHFIK